MRTLVWDERPYTATSTPAHDEVVAKLADQAGVSPAQVESGWYPDPAGNHEQRYWNGREWTGRVRDGTRSSRDRLARVFNEPRPRLPGWLIALLVSFASIVVIGVLVLGQFAHNVGKSLGSLVPTTLPSPPSAFVQTLESYRPPPEFSYVKVESYLGDGPWLRKSWTTTLTVPGACEVLRSSLVSSWPNRTFIATTDLKFMFGLTPVGFPFTGTQGPVACAFWSPGSVTVGAQSFTSGTTTTVEVATW